MGQIMNPKYRATLHDNDLTRERSQTTYSNSPAVLEEWADKILAGAIDGAAVIIYETTERQMRLISKAEAIKRNQAKQQKRDKR
jgi:hypothetical protein